MLIRVLHPGGVVARLRRTVRSPRDDYEGCENLREIREEESVGNVWRRKQLQGSVCL